VLANGYLRFDPQEWVRAVEKGRAALLGGLRQGGSRLDRSVNGLRFKQG
jgi:hypothetical protein